MRRASATYLAILLTACDGTSAIDAGSDAANLLDAEARSDADTSSDADVAGSACPSFQAGRTVGTRVCAEGVSPGYTLFSPMGGLFTYLIDLDGRLVHLWTHTDPPGQLAYLLEDGRLLRPTDLGAGPFMAGGQAGGLELITWNGVVEWSFRYMGEDVRSHHDVAWLPNGHVILIAWERVSAEEANAAGRREPLGADELWPDHLIEVRPESDGGATVVWEWHAWDHLVQDNDPSLATYGAPREHPGRIDVDLGGTRNADWLHINAIDYDAAHDQLVLTVHETSEVWIIDHATTTEEAAGPAGDLLYRWGNPEAWGAGTGDERHLFLPHNAHLIDDDQPGAGHLLIFNNGDPPARSASSVDEIALPRGEGRPFTREADGSYGPDGLIWTYGDPTFRSPILSGAQRLADGNTRICEGVIGRLFEVTPDGALVWEYRVPVGTTGPLIQGTTFPSRPVFRAYRYDPTYSGLAGRDLTPGDFIELPAR